MKKFATSFLIFTAACWLLGSLGYPLLSRFTPFGNAFGTLWRMPSYHYQHPYQYILVVAFAYGLTAALWAQFLGHLTGIKRVASIVAVMLLALLLACVPGGLLYEIHDIQAGFVPPMPVLRNNLMRSATNGLTTGWLIVGLSLPYNILGAVVGYFVTHFGQKALERRFGANKAIQVIAAERGKT